VASRTRRAGRQGRLATSARFLLRSLALRHTPFLLALIAVTVGATLAATILNLQADLRAKMSKELRRYGPNLLLTPGPRAMPATLEEKAVREIPAILAAQQPGTSLVVSPLLLAAGKIGPATGGTDSSAPVTVVGVDFVALRLLNPSWRVKGVYPRAGESSCLVGTALARRLGLAPGKKAVISVDSRVGLLAVSGTLSTGESEEEEVLVPLPFLQERTGLAGRVSLAAISVDGGPSAVKRAGAAVARAIHGASARPLWQVAASQGSILAKLDRMMVFLTLSVLTLCGLCLMSTLLSIVLEREPEIGLMRSIGAGDAEVLKMFLAEVSLLGILGGALGLVLGAFAARLVGDRLFDAAIEPRAGVVPLVLAVSLGLCWIAVLLPLRRALAVQPAAALRGD